MKEFIGIAFCLVGGIITYGSLLFLSYGKNKNKSFSISLNTIFLLLLSLFFLLPLTIKVLNNKFVSAQSYAFIFLMLLLSFCISKLIYKYTSKKEFNSDLYILGIAFLIFFIIEGLNLYSITLISIKSGLIMLLKYSIYNIILATIFLNYFNKTEKKKLVKVLSFLSFSIFISGLVSFIFEIIFDKSFAIGILSSIAFGMFIYIITFILYPNFKNISDRKSKVLGLLLGGFIYALITLF